MKKARANKSRFKLQNGTVIDGETGRHLPRLDPSLKAYAREYVAFAQMGRERFVIVDVLQTPAGLMWDYAPLGGL